MRIVSKDIARKQLSLSLIEATSLFLRWVDASSTTHVAAKRKPHPISTPLCGPTDRDHRRATGLLILFWASLTLLGWMTLGYLSHDLSDVGEDRTAGKTNLWSDHQYEGNALLIVSAGVAVGPWYFLPSTLFIYVLLSAELGVSYVVCDASVSS